MANNWIIMSIVFLVCFDKVLMSWPTALPFQVKKNFQTFDASKEINFCKTECVVNEVLQPHIACQCHGENNGTFRCKSLNDLQKLELRHYLLVYINTERQKLASGVYQFSKSNISNMNAVSYDVALEYVARCSAQLCDSKAIQADNGCLRTKKFRNVYQYVIQFSNSRFLFGEHFLNKLKTILDQIVWTQSANFTQATGNALKLNRTHIGVFWADATHVGCYAKYKRMSRLSGVEYIFVFVCNFGNSHEEEINDILYKTGKPCSECHKEQINCNEDFPALCGNIELISPDELPSFSAAIRPNSNTVLFFIFILFYLVNR